MKVKHDCHIVSGQGDNRKDQADGTNLSVTVQRQSADKPCTLSENLELMSHEKPIINGKSCCQLLPSPLSLDPDGNLSDAGQPHSHLQPLPKRTAMMKRMNKLLKVLLPFFVVYGSPRCRASPNTMYSHKSSRLDQSPWMSTGEDCDFSNRSLAVSPMSTTLDSSELQTTIRAYVLHRIGLIAQKIRLNKWDVHREQRDLNQGFPYLEDEFITFACEHGTTRIAKPPTKLHELIARLLSKF